jgi:hypothetical protein
LEEQQALQHDVWGASDWHAFQAMAAQYQLVESLLSELAVNGEED